MEINSHGIQLGDTVKCTITGFKGKVVGITKYYNGCVQCTIAPKYDGKAFASMEEAQVDIQSLEIVKKYKKDIEEEEELGGPTKRGVRVKGY